MFEFGMDVIQTTILPVRRTMDEKIASFGQAGPTLRDGNFIWTTSSDQEVTLQNPDGTESVEQQTFYSTQMLSICSPG